MKVQQRKAACLVFDGFDHGYLLMESGSLPHAICRLGQAAVVSASGCPASLLCWDSLTNFVSAPTCCAESQPLPNGAKLDWLISLESEGESVKALEGTSLTSFWPALQEVRTTVTSSFEVFNCNAENEDMLRIATSSNYIDSESLVNDTVEWMPLWGDVRDLLVSLPCKKWRSPDVLGSVRVRCSGQRQ